MDDRILYLPTLGQKFWFGTDNSFTENIQEDMEISYCFSTNNEKSSIGGSPSLVPRLLPYRKTGREPGRTDHVPRGRTMRGFMTIELLPTQSVPLSMAVLSGTRAVICVLDQWMSLRL